MRRLIETGKIIYEKGAPPLSAAAEMAYRKYRNARLSFRHYDREHGFIKNYALKEMRKIMKFRNEYEFQLYVRGFERAFARYQKTGHALGTHSGTAALQFSLTALGISEGDEVITAPNTYIATALAISNTGATPVFADTDEETFNIDPGKVEDAITERTKAIIPVHLYGNPAGMGPIMEIAKRHGLAVVEDACQAHGAEYAGKKAGSIGDAGCFSFFTSKNLSGLGEGGMIVSRSRSFIEKANKLGDPESGSPTTLSSRRTPCRLDAVQAAFLKPKLRFLDKWNAARRKKAKLYNEMLFGTGVTTPAESSKGKHVYFSYVIRTSNRDLLKKHLLARGIETAVEYETPVHLTRTFGHLGYKRGDFTAAEMLSQEILSLPISPFIEDEEIARICREIKSFRKP